MKPAARWSEDELVIALYFSSRRISSMAVSQLLTRRGYHRTPCAVERKIQAIVGDHPSLRPSGGSWDVDAVDLWLDDVLGNAEDVNRLIKFTPEDAEIVAQVVNASEIQHSFLLSTLLTAEGSINLSSTPYGHPRNWVHGG
ncbi:hypothetical protein IFM61392_10422 [Aspergillus lentulus]|nr:hypothetical protein IFM47457_10995 [Aspergillus lentulus]GFG18175.1 hypothetical protein IFM61392_10422 [Aspergillus lentulus]